MTKCNVCFAPNHATSDCRVRCRRCWNVGQHLTSNCDVVHEDVKCVYCKEVGHVVGNCHKAQRDPAKISPAQKKLGFCVECELYGHDFEKHGCTAADCSHCKSNRHGSYNCPTQRKCRECGELGHISSGCPNVKCRDCRKMGHNAHNCPTARCSWCAKEYSRKPELSRHSRHVCKKIPCNWCGVAGHRRGTRCPEFQYDIEFQRRYN